MADMNKETAAEEGTVRATLYNIFADTLARSLDESWLNPHFQGRLKAGLPAVPGKEEMLAALARAAAEREYFKEIQLDYDALFRVPGPKLIFPYESCYTRRNIDGSFGRLWQEPAQDMQRILKEWDLSFAEGWDLIPDHIAVELFFMGHLCSVQGQQNLQGGDRDMLGEWQARFMENHLSNWVFELLDNLERKAETPFYRGLARLLRAFLEEEKTALA
ncbi:MAG: TorD/DmsD family molecular chaperone [Desulfitobacteriaceae bacterium]